MKYFLLPLFMVTGIVLNAQLVIDNATFFIGENAVVTVQGNLTTNVAIQAGGAGATLGKIQLKGTSLQQISTGGNLIPRLEIDNTNHAQLTGDVKIGSRLEFTNGKIQLVNNNFILDGGVVVVGSGTSKFLETNGTGEVRTLVNSNAASIEIPVGYSSNYTPFQFTTSGSTYGAGAYVGVITTGTAVPSPQKHPRTESYIGTSWKVSKSGITGGTLVGKGTYVDGIVTGTESDLRGMFWNGSSWSMAGGAQNTANNTVAANVTSNTGEIFGMNKFILSTPKVFLQGAFNSGTGLMNDNLRSGGANLIPTSDPYRTASYIGAFPHVNNAVAESVDGSIFINNVNPENDLVDWVFVELRNVISPTQATVTQTRSVLVQRDGDLVDIDGVSPVYFKNVDEGNYVLAIRHRNHLGLSVNPATPVNLTLAGGSFNFTTVGTGSLFGTADVNYARTNNINMLYSGNTNLNGNVRFGGPSNDKDYLLSNGLSSNPASVLSNVYSGSDVNMNRIVRFGGPGNDKDFILNNPLATNPAITKSQALPN